MTAPFDVLRAASFFSDLDDSELERIAELVEPVDLPKGQVLFSEGSPSDAVYFIVSGQVRVGKGQGEGPTRFERFLATLEAGDVFGELSLLLDEPRTAGVLASEPTRLLRLGRDRFLGLLEARDELSWHLHQVLLVQASERLRDAVTTGARPQTGPADTQAMINGLVRLSWR